MTENVTWAMKGPDASMKNARLRVLAIHEAEKQWYFTFCLIFLRIHDV